MKQQQVRPKTSYTLAEITLLPIEDLLNAYEEAVCKYPRKDPHYARANLRYEVKNRLQAGDYARTLLLERKGDTNESQGKDS